MQYIAILHILLHQATTTVKKWAGMDFPYLIHIDRTTALTPFTHLFITCPLECLAHTFECQRLMRIDC